MKILLTIFAALLFFNYSAEAQRFSLGIKGGANLNKVNGKSWKDEFTFGYHLGAYATVGGNRFAIQPEVLFNEVNLDTAHGFSDVYNFNHIDNIRLQYLSIPVLLNYNVSKVLTLQAGPQFGILLNQDKDLLQNGEDAFKSGNFSLVGGVELHLLRLRIYGRFVSGTTNINNLSSSDTWKTTAVQVGAGFGL